MGLFTNHVAVVGLLACTMTLVSLLAKLMSVVGLGFPLVGALGAFLVGLSLVRRESLSLRLRFSVSVGLRIAFFVLGGRMVDLAPLLAMFAIAAAATVGSRVGVTAVAFGGGVVVDLLSIVATVTVRPGGGATSTLVLLGRVMMDLSRIAAFTTTLATVHFSVSISISISISIGLGLGLCFTFVTGAVGTARRTLAGTLVFPGVVLLLA